MTIKAIETSYKGYRFRSRLEARWAVFFDALGVPFQYEKEGFDIGKLGWYLPDFWMPTWKCWIEIKPEVSQVIPDPLPDEWLKCIELSQSLKQAVYLNQGDPFPGEHAMWDLSHYNSYEVDIDDETTVTIDDDFNSYNHFASCRHECPEICLLDWQDGDSEGWRFIGQHSCDNSAWPMPCIDEDGQVIDDRIFLAYKAARSARFEHGEKGSPRP